MFQEKIIELLSKETSLKNELIEEILEIPPRMELGDFSFPCFALIKKYKKKPVEIAQYLQKKFSEKLIKELEKIESKGPYLNFFINKQLLAKEILQINASFGKQNIGKKKKIVIDFSQPNIGKPMHVGHIRSTILGDSLMRIYNFLNYFPIGVNYLGDVGLHIGKLIVAYELWLDKKALQKDPVKELLRLYVKFCAEEKSEVTEGTEEEFQDNEWTNKAKEKLRLLELGDVKAHKIWNDIRKHSEKGFNKIYEILQVNFTETVGQSQFSDKGKEIVLDALKKGIAKRETDGAVYVEYQDKSKEVRKKFILRNNQTASYITQDLGAAVLRNTKYKFEKMIYVVDFRQSDHFDSLFSILKMLGYDFSEKCHHLSFGAVKFENEIFATREGKVILLEDVLAKTIEKAKKEIQKRKTAGSPEKVGVGAVKYMFLKNEPIKDISFSWDILNFEGNTGPYLQYSYARASSIIKKAKNTNIKLEIPELSQSEIALMLKISRFPEAIRAAGEKLNPALIANYSYELAQLFNEFYHNCPVLTADPKLKSFRLQLIESFRTTVKNALHLLGIEVMEEM
ncbi:arginine--tRNA ligase [Candidatus Pacearchaeota archaeon]|nr:arginine--tRNA ligase [Candidatus Pacearchaeota archaeon]